MFVRYRLTDRAKHFREVSVLGATFHFLNDDQQISAVFLDGKCSTAAGSQRRMTPLRCQLKVLWIVVTASNDDQVSESAGYEQFAGDGKSQVARSKICFVTVWQRGAEVLTRRRAPPIALRHGWTSHPNLAHFTTAALLQRVGIDNRNLRFQHRPATAHKRL